MFVRSTKTKRPKLRVRIPRPLLSVLAEMAKRPHRDSDSVVSFWSPSRNITLARHCEKCGLPRMNAMALRHTGASWVASETGITVSLARYMGHSSVRQLERTYAHYLPPQLQEVTDALERFAANTNGGGEKP